MAARIVVASVVAAVVDMRRSRSCTFVDAAVDETGVVVAGTGGDNVTFYGM